MNVLIVAYACEPGKGSEPGIGWDWTTGLARQPGLNVTVLTRSNNRGTIEAALNTSGPTPQFVYWDIPGWLSWWKSGRAAIYPYYCLWCRGVRNTLRRIVRERDIDIVHHLTFSTDWLPGSVPERLPCASVAGPLGGYDTADEMDRFVHARYRRIDRWKKRVRSIGLKLRRRELARHTRLLANNAGFGKTYGSLIPGVPVDHVSTQVSTAVPADTILERPPNTRKLIVMAGRIVYWKGFDAALQALAAYRDRAGDFRTVFVGSGDATYVAALKRASTDLSLDVEFRVHMARPEFLNLLGEADVFLYPTFYGTADSIMMEAVERNLPVVCFPSHGAVELLGADYPHIAAGFEAGHLADRLEHADRTSPGHRAASAAIVERHAPDRKLKTVAEIYARAVAGRRAARCAD